VLGPWFGPTPCWITFNRLWVKLPWLCFIPVATMVRTFGCSERSKSAPYYRAFQAYPVMRMVMQIQNLFKKDIFRSINGVIKAHQLDEHSVWQELDEFVLTRELDKHFRKFFSAYWMSWIILTMRPLQIKMGVWISGFFGSGKSHFLKSDFLFTGQQAPFLWGTDQTGGWVLRFQDSGRHAFGGHQTGSRVQYRGSPL